MSVGTAELHRQTGKKVKFFPFSIAALESKPKYLIAKQMPRNSVSDSLHKLDIWLVSYFLAMFEASFHTKISKQVR